MPYAEKGLEIIWNFFISKYETIFPILNLLVFVGIPTGVVFILGKILGINPKKSRQFMSDLKLKKVDCFGLSAYQVLRGMVLVYGIEKVENALKEIRTEFYEKLIEEVAASYQPRIDK